MFGIVHWCSYHFPFFLFIHFFFSQVSNGINNVKKRALDQFLLFVWWLWAYIEEEFNMNHTSISEKEENECINIKLQYIGPNKNGIDLWVSNRLPVYVRESSVCMSSGAFISMRLRFTHSHKIHMYSYWIYCDIQQFINMEFIKII